jgi:hypothetical protein
MNKGVEGISQMLIKFIDCNTSEPVCLIEGGVQEVTKYR